MIELAEFLGFHACNSFRGNGGCIALYKWSGLYMSCLKNLKIIKAFHKDCRKRQIFYKQEYIKGEMHDDAGKDDAVLSFIQTWLSTITMFR